MGFLRKSTACQGALNACCCIIRTGTTFSGYLVLLESSLVKLLWTATEPAKYMETGIANGMPVLRERLEHMDCTGMSSN
jgi:hypothetical protein